MTITLVALPGDGIGPEVTDAALRVIGRVAADGGHQIEVSHHAIGGSSLDRHGTPLTEEVLNACRGSQAVFLGAVGGPAWDGVSAALRPERGLLALRKGLGVYANLRPVRTHASLSGVSPLKPERLRGVDILVVRELTGGVYFGEPRLREETPRGIRAVDTVVYTEAEIRRVLHLAFSLAQNRRGRVTSVDKANVLETSRLWRETASAMAGAFPDVQLEHLLVDTASMRLITSPSSFDVLVTENMFGDILTDEAGVLAGSLGMLPSASLGEDGPGLYEPVHGSAPDIAGTGKANPLGAILSAALLLRYSLRLEAEAQQIEEAVDRVVDQGCRTADLGGTMGLEDMTQAVLEALHPAAAQSQRLKRTHHSSKEQ
jgi:3-isopropylmalate dehydrogenase